MHWFVREGTGNRAKATKSQLKWFSEELQKVNSKRLTLHKGYPHSTAQTFSLPLNYYDLKELEAKTYTDLWRAKIQLAKLKLVWVVNVRGGNWNWSTWLEKVKRRFELVLIEKIDEVWKEACEIEAMRQRIIVNRRKAKNNNCQKWKSPEVKFKPA